MGCERSGSLAFARVINSRDWMRNHTFQKKKIPPDIKDAGTRGDLGHEAVGNSRCYCSEPWLQLSLVLASPASQGTRPATLASLALSGRVFSTSASLWGGG